MAVIKSNPALQALTLAALALPGLILPAAGAAEDDEVNFQYSHYEEGKRNLYNVLNNKNPIEVESVVGKARVSLSDRIKFAFNYIQDTWSGATPITTAPLAANGNRAIKANTANNETIITGASPYINNARMFLTQKFVPILIYDKTVPGKKLFRTAQPVHVLSMASPETRKQGDFTLGYEWDEAAIKIGGGLSVEHDYESRFGNLSGRLDFNQKRTTLDMGLSYTNSDNSAILDHDAETYITKKAFAQQIEKSGTMQILHGNRQDWATSLGLTQVLNKSALVQTSVAYTRSTGYLENPYKVMTIVFADPATLGTDPDHPNSIVGDVRAFLEQRPNERNQLTVGSRFIQHIAFADAALHLDYRFFHDDWGINAHTFEADWVQAVGPSWTITPKIRYYSQDAADFYHPYLISKQTYAKALADPGTLPANFSSDQRLSAFGALSGGVTINKKLSKAVSIEAGFEYYTHAGALKMGGGGEGSYSDFDYYLANAALNVNLAALNTGGSQSGHSHAHHGKHHGSHGPAGVMFGHMLDQANDVMLGYRYMYSRQAGDTLHGIQAVTDQTIRNNGCLQAFTKHCRVTPTYMDMSMHMLDIMYAPTDWLNLMLMPQFMDMDMDLRLLEGVSYNAFQDHLHGGHRTGGVGDTGMYALFKLFDTGNHHVHATLGLSAPTGDVDIKLRAMHGDDKGLLHYGMQLGSGTWDFKPSLTYTGMLDDWSWGAQFSATNRLESKNDSGYALGDMFQGTAWGNYHLTNWLSASVRGIYTVQGKIDGRFNRVAGVVDNVLVNNVNPGSKANFSSGPMDFGGNYGGRYWDLGLGLNFTVPSGDLKGNSLGVEWLQPIEDDVNGYQLEREGALSATWSVMF
ncbi:MAG: DUF3570 domain-containing protein [Methylovulum sp.]|uniref:DUF3570 domain-containing protein n=1 Tax=Methylovulum sp. TaxID=1916980 RepID=UPI0026020B03|nr:DUF3570 domain-containing protein [Methylovulum sp.]MDD2723023.1 DUF3570 domain-containing protein [Methylovulum sp.]MDD5124765.1 DUF3570 domain-containing protein [Methylovulum sp.]